MTLPLAHDRLQPSLLDRLIDADTSRDGAGRTLSRRQLREVVARDLVWLLNATRPEPSQEDDPWLDAPTLPTRGDERRRWREASHARASVLNFGLPAMTGLSQGSLDSRRLQRELAEAIRRFEPRLIPETLHVAVEGAASERCHNQLRLVIQGQLLSDPVPLDLWLAAELDLETGHARLRELRA
ncbi:type VI secretion system baseplate subunit TssE [Aquabacterium sp. A7-Y]|uniref:type VI secretion system baseplate subunit TssE n=1 Tax=Aquabacterium sp. A7-Y TaxID=1349605 RepID=UPI00223D597D|nr:type VI secretion system baseplate subunit TssE [Aquabacterium sp. A7-Y]MCW7539699.1 type VI secretion system baseplate subunit TssE [Aquabacterium sp. A7-Y]